MVPRRFVRLAIVDAVGRVHAHLTPPGLEDQPTRASAQRILDVGPAEDVAKECARCGGIVGINQGVDAGDHQTELLKSPKIVLFQSIANQEAVSSHWRSKLGHYRRDEFLEAVAAQRYNRTVSDDRLASPPVTSRNSGHHA